MKNVKTKLIAALLFAVSMPSWSVPFLGTEPAYVNVLDAKGLCEFKLPSTMYEFTLKGTNLYKLSKGESDSTNPVKETLYKSLNDVLKEECNVSDTVLNSPNFKVTGFYVTGDYIKFTKGYILLTKLKPNHILYTY